MRDAKPCARFGSKHRGDWNVHRFSISAIRNNLHHCWVHFKEKKRKKMGIKKRILCVEGGESTETGSKLKLLHWSIPFSKNIPSNPERQRSPTAGNWVPGNKNRREEKKRSAL